MLKKVHNIRRFSLMIILVIMCCSILAFILTSTIAASDEKETKRDILSYLDTRKIEYSYAEVENKLLTVKLNSHGSGYCTLDDVKAIQAIYEAVHGDNIIGNVEDVSISIYDTNGKLIYDLYSPGVSEMPDIIQNISAAETYNTRTSSEVVELILMASPFETKTMTFSSARQIDGCKLELTVDANTPSFPDLQSLYRELEAHFICNNEITQCAISVEHNGECVLYMGGDFKYGNYISWISPELQTQLQP